MCVCVCVWHHSLIKPTSSRCASTPRVGPGRGTEEGVSCVVPLTIECSSPPRGLCDGQGRTHGEGGVRLRMQTVDDLEMIRLQPSASPSPAPFLTSFEVSHTQMQSTNVATVSEGCCRGATST